MSAQQEKFPVFEIKDYPPLPRWIEEIALSPETQHDSKWLNYFDDRHSNREIIKQDGTVELSQVQKRYRVGQEIQDWVKQHIHSDIIDCGITVSYFNDRPSMGAHTDSTRSFTLIYLLATGGESVETVFWQEKEKPLIRPLGTLPHDYRDLERIDGIVIPEKTWVLLDARVLHGIENLTGKRIAFQVSLDHWID
jgi:hypothetical protein